MSTSLPMPSSCFSVRNSCSVPWVRSSWRCRFRRAAPCGSRGCIRRRAPCALLMLYADVVQFFQHRPHQRHMVPEQRLDDQRAVVHQHPFDDGPAPLGRPRGRKKPGDTSPALAKLVSWAGPGWRSTTVTSWPALAGWVGGGGADDALPGTRTRVIFSFSNSVVHLSARPYKSVPGQNRLKQRSWRITPSIRAALYRFRYRCPPAGAAKPAFSFYLMVWKSHCVFNTL